MNAPRLAIFCGLAVFGLGLSCFGEPPIAPDETESETVRQLCREVEELKQTVNALRARLGELEYQGLPRAPKLMPDGQLSAPAPIGHLRFPYEIERGTSAPLWLKRSRTNR